MTVFDFVTVACFFGAAGAFFIFTARELSTLFNVVLAGISFAIANQLGNAEYILLGALVMIAGVAYAVVVIRKG